VQCISEYWQREAQGVQFARHTWCLGALGSTEQHTLQQQLTISPASSAGGGQ